MAINTDNYPDDFAALMDEYSREVSTLMARLEGGMDVGAWQDEMKRLLARYSQAARLLGNGNNALLPEETAATREWLNDQYKYLDGFSSVIESAGGQYNPGWLSRAEMYGASTTIEYWEGKTEGLPLPAMPAQQTQCFSNCRCQWRIEWINKANGDADCYWDRSEEAQSCQTCLTRAEMWNPVRIRGGDLQE